MGYISLVSPFFFTPLFPLSLVTGAMEHKSEERTTVEKRRSRMVKLGVSIMCILVLGN